MIRILKNKVQLREKLQWLFSNPWILGIFLFFLLVQLFSVPLKPYKIKLFSTQTLEKEVAADFCDLDSDGNSEYIRLSNYHSIQSNAHIYNSSGNFLAVWNIEGIWPGFPSPWFDDFDKNGYKEVYIFTISYGDSLFLNIKEILAQKGATSRHFITRLNRFKGHLDYAIRPVQLADINGDKSPEFIFLVNGGFSLQPRAIFAVDMLNDSLYQSDESASSLYSVADIHCAQTDTDEAMEIFLTTIATDNYGNSRNLPYSDSLSWLMVLTRDLKFLFPPFPMAGMQSICSVVPSGDTKYPFISMTINPRKGGGPSAMRLHDPTGNIVKKRELLDATGKVHSLKVHENQIYYIITDMQGMRIEKIDANLHTRSVFDLPGLSNLQWIDADLDSQTESVMVSKTSNELIVFRKDWKQPVKIEMDSDIQNIKFLRNISINNKPSGIAIITPEKIYQLRYDRYPWYFLNYVALFSLYLLSVLLIKGLIRILKVRLLKQQTREWEFQQLQLQNTMNQLDPHFLFNAINAIGSEVLSGEKEKAYEHFTRIAGLIRDSLKNAFLPSKSLKEELEFVQKYLEVEAIRFPGKFLWTITVDPGSDLDQQIPKMLVQLFVENSIKHGLFRQQTMGVIEIVVKPEPPGTLITITDNGVGIGVTLNETSNPDEKGYGLKIMERYLKLFRQQFQKEIRYRVLDRVEEGAGKFGTCVIIKIEHKLGDFAQSIKKI